MREFLYRLFCSLRGHADVASEQRQGVVDYTCGRCGAGWTVNTDQGDR